MDVHTNLQPQQPAFGKGEVVEVKELKGVRIVPIELGEGKQRPRGSISHLLEGWPAGHLVRVATQQFLHTLDLSALQWLTACTCISRCMLQSSDPLGQLQCWAGSIRADWLSQRTVLVLVLPETPGCRLSAPRLQARQQPHTGGCLAQHAWPVGSLRKIWRTSFAGL